MKHAPATARNRGPILAALRDLLPPVGLILEIASGTGEHAAFMMPQLAEGLKWQPSDADADACADIDAHARASDCPRILKAVHLDVRDDDWPLSHADAILCCNMLHIAPWSAARGLFAGAARILPPAGPLILYGPFKRGNIHTAPSNAQFDASLRARDPAWGVRCLDGEVEPLAKTQGLNLQQILQMPANNLLVAFRRDQ